MEMTKKKLLFISNNLQYSDGVAICLKRLVNALTPWYDIRIFNLYKNDRDFIKDMSENVKVKNFFGFYFKGLRSITNRFLTDYLTRYILKNFRDSDFMISYQAGTPTVLINRINNSKKKGKAKTLGFIHTFNTSQLKYYRSADGIVSISEDGRQEACRHLPECSPPIVHLRNLYDMEEIKNKAKESCPEIRILKESGKRVFCTVSRLSPEKGIDRFIQAMADFHCEDSSAVGVIVGDGPIRNQLEKQIKGLHAEGYIYMVGSKNNPYPYMYNCDYFCCPSRSEGLCTSCVEAAILKTPILSTDVSGAREIVENPNIGYVVENNDFSFLNGLRNIVKMEINESEFDISVKKWDSQNVIMEYLDFFNGF